MSLSVGLNKVLLSCFVAVFFFAIACENVSTQEPYESEDFSQNASSCTESSSSSSSQKIELSSEQPLSNGISVKSSSSLAGPNSFAALSSSATQSSSSSSKLFTIDDMEFGKIGPYEFATKNLNIPVEGGRCYNDLEENCERFGRLYTWAAALALDESYNFKYVAGLKEPHQGICPDGTHIVTEAELDDLFRLMEDDTMLTEENNLFEKLNGGQGGFFDSAGIFMRIDSAAGFWIANESIKNANYASMITFENTRSGLATYIAFRNKTVGAFVRCVKGTVVVSSSSSADVSSSSSKADLMLSVAEGCESATRENWKYLNPNVEYGCIKDSRDGRFYKTLVLDDQMWLAENLRYVPENKKIQSWCYSEKDGECDVFGRYYQGNAVNANPEICPEGFHVPSMEELKKITKYENKSLISIDGWKPNNYSFEGDNMTGMSFIPSGVRGYDDGLGHGWETGVYRYVDMVAYAWTSSSDYFLGFHVFSVDNYSNMDLGGMARGFGIPIRCVKN